MLLAIVAGINSNLDNDMIAQMEPILKTSVTSVSSVVNDFDFLFNT
ncbi:MAG: hypothetical protein BMS9Abin25_1297 [Gammaproteobacteria bacterium]|nr:MAG: hypothetical protein BMS9Abin25_1297 [Gammaproteobacteria bacterium]